ncbi:MAG: MauE/DoxX family redox-associated membrane protein [Thermodesulfobacteriota bacterium]
MTKGNASAIGLVPQGLLSPSVISRLCADTVGIVIIGAGLMKATDMALFIRQIAAYGLLSHPLLVTWGAWAMIGVQFGLGLALLLFYRPAITLGLTLLLWVGLSGLTAWAWWSGVTDECGCYGAWLKTTPNRALIENLVFLSLTLASWRTYRPNPLQGGRKRAWAVIGACAAGLALPLLLGFPISAMISPGGRDAPERIGEVRMTGLKEVDLARGAYVLVLLGTDCLHCQELLPDMDGLASRKDIPPTIGLTKNSEAEVRKFVEEFDPSFPIGQVGEKDFWRLLGSGKMPRIMLVRDGRVQKVWDGQMPKYGEL